jgi:hypothetical protein
VSRTRDVPRASETRGKPGRERPTARATGGGAWRAIEYGAVFAGFAVVTGQAMGGRLGRLDKAAMTALRNRRRLARVVAGARAVGALAEPTCVCVLMAANVLPAARRAGWRAACASCVVAACCQDSQRVRAQADDYQGGDEQQVE